MNSLRLVRTGLTLSALGVAAYHLSGKASKTALIPAYIGAPAAAFGALSVVPGVRRTAANVGNGLVLIGFFGSVSGFKQLPQLVTHGANARPAAVLTKTAMACVCARHLVTTLFDR